MPEGHTIHRLAHDHTQWFAGQTLEVSSPQGRFADGAAMLNGQRLQRVFAHGKHLLYEWSSSILHIHLGLYGKYRVHRLPPPEPRGAVRLRMTGDERSVDLNGPTACELLSPAKLRSLRDRLGQDPLDDDADPEPVWKQLSKRRSSIGQLLLDQSLIAGIGNVYRAEILFLLGIHPTRPGRDLTRQEFDQLWDCTVKLLKIGVRYNKIIVADPNDVGKPRSRMNRNERLLIYKKEFCGRCETPVEVLMLGARKTFACPVCQAK